MRTNIVISDDEKESLSSNCLAVSRCIEASHIDAKITLCTTNPSEVLEYSKKYHTELNVYILDINFNKELNGLTLARSIREQEPYAYIIFLTAYVQLSMLTFKYKLKVFDFLIKPASFQDISECLKALTEDLERSYGKKLPVQQNHINVKSGYQEYDLVVEDIIYIESYNQKLIIHTKEGCLETYSTLKDMETELSALSNNFCRCHKSFLVNLRYIKKIDLINLELTMITDEKCLISRSQKSYFRNITA